MHSAMRFQSLWEAGALFHEDTAYQDEMFDAAAFLLIFSQHIKHQKRLGMLRRLAIKRMWKQVHTRLVEGGFLLGVSKYANSIIEQDIDRFWKSSTRAGRTILSRSPTLDHGRVRQLALDNLYDLAGDA